MRLIAMAGLPGTGKSAVARALSLALGALVLDKDRVREVMFGDGVDYSREQDDRAVAAMYATVEELASRGLECAILDGRTYSRRYQVEELRGLARRIGARLDVVECVCDEGIALARLERDRRVGAHPAGNRGAELYLALRAAAEPIEGATLVLDTSAKAAPDLAQGLIEQLGLAP